MPEPVDTGVLEDLLRSWQQRLRLQDWDITVKVVRRHELRSPSVVGQTRISMYRCAHILLCDPVDFTSDDWGPERDLEITLVHELLHLHFDDVGVNFEDKDGMTPPGKAMERGIDYAARALVALSRRGPA